MKRKKRRRRKAMLIVIRRRNGGNKIKDTVKILGSQYKLNGTMMKEKNRVNPRQRVGGVR